MNHDRVSEQKWEFRRKDSDLDSSSEEKGSNPAKDGKLEDCNQSLRFVPVVDEDQQMPLKGAQNQPIVVQKNSQDKYSKKRDYRRGPRIAKSKKIGHEQSHSIDALQGLKMHVSILVKELNTSREGYMRWMADELEKLVPSSAVASLSNHVSTGKSCEWQEMLRRSHNKRGKSIKKMPRSSKEVNANRVAEMPTKIEKDQEDVPNTISKTPNVLALADRSFIASNYLNLPNLTPRPLAENYLVEPSSTTVRLQTVILDPYYQGINFQSRREFSQPDVCASVGLDRSLIGSKSGSIGSHGGFPSTGQLGFKGSSSIPNLGLAGPESSAQENNFPSLRMMGIFAGDQGVRDDEMNNNHIRSNRARTGSSHMAKSRGCDLR